MFLLLESKQLFFILAIFKEILPEEFLLRYAREGVREDGRGFETTRPVKVLRKNKVTLLSMGQTLIMANSEVTMREEKKINGIANQVTPLIDVQVKQNIGQHGSSDVVSPFEIVKQESYHSQMLTNFIQKNYKNLTSVLEVAKEIQSTYWTLVVNLRVVNNDGNLSDALILATQIELFNCQVSEIVVKNIDGGLVVQPIEGKERFLNFSIDDFYYPFTSSLINSELIVVDPSNYEEAHAAATVQVLVNLSSSQGKSISKLGGRNMSIKELQQISNQTDAIASSKFSKIREYLTSHTEEFSL